MVESMRDREIELITYLRNNVTDPSSRGTSATQLFNGAAGVVTFTLTNTLVKTISAVTVGGVSMYIGYDYTISYGEGTAQTTITFTTAPAVGTNNISVTYRYGDCMIYEGFQRLDSALPRISIIFAGATPEYMSIGEQAGSTGNWIYYNSNYTCEIRSRYAKQLKTVLNDFSTKVHQFRQSLPQPYRTIVVTAPYLQSYDFDNELRLYRALVGISIKWMVRFKD